MILVLQFDLHCLSVKRKGSFYKNVFVDSAYRGKGVGAVALQYVLDKLQVYKVDVNEQNQQAVDFYLKKGYQLIGRSAVDGMGKSYPILHLHHESAINGLK